MSTKCKDNWNGNVLTKIRLHLHVLVDLGLSGYCKELTKFRGNFIGTLH